MKTFSKFASWTVSFLGALISVYLLWGWITTTDLKRYCKEKNLDFDKVADTFLTSKIDGVQATQVIGSDGSTNADMKVSFRETLPIERLGLSYSFFAKEAAHVSSGTNGVQMFFVDGAVIEPFLAFSSNFLGVLFCFGLGYLISFTILLSKSLRKDDIRNKVVALRPFVGGCCAVCIYLIILSLGSLLMETSGDVRPSAMGLVGVAGALIGERFERLLKKNFDGPIDRLLQREPASEDK